MMPFMHMLLLTLTMMRCPFTVSNQFIEFGSFRAVSKADYRYNSKNKLVPGDHLIHLFKEDHGWFDRDLSLSTSYHFAPTTLAPMHALKTLQPTNRVSRSSQNPSATISSLPTSRRTMCPKFSKTPTAKSIFPSSTPHKKGKGTLEPSISGSGSVLPTIVSTISTVPSHDVRTAFSHTIIPTTVSSTIVSKLPNYSNVPSAAVVPSNPTMSQFTMLPTFLNQAGIASDTPTLSNPSDTPSDTQSDTPTVFQNSDAVAFYCNKNGVTFTRPPFDAITVVDITVTYEINTKTSWQTLQTNLELKILKTAVSGALQCALYLGCDCDPQDVPMLTQETREVCSPIINNTSCYVLETSFQLLLQKEVNSNLAASFAYTFVQEQMENGSFKQTIPELEHVSYLRPDIVTPSAVNQQTAAPGLASEGASVSLSPWTVGAVSAMSLGGVAALLLWARNRRVRNERHMHLLEDMSGGSPQSTTVLTQAA